MSFQQLRTDRRAQLATAIVVFVLVLLAVAFAATRSAGTVEVGRTKDSDRFASWRWKLDTGSVHYTVHRDGDESVLTVAASDADSVKVQLASSGTIGGAASPKCPKVSAFAGDSGQSDHDTCELERSVHEQVTTTAGVLEAIVALREVESDSLVDAGDHITVSINIYPDPHAAAKIDASGLAHAIARTTGDNDLHDVLIRVHGSGTIWPAPAAATAGEGTTACTTGSAGAANVDARNRYETCRARQLRQLVAPMVGGADRVHVADNVTITAGESHEVRHVVAGGVQTQTTVNSSASAASSSQQSTRTIAPSTTDVESSRPSGVVEHETVSVVLDGATPAQEQAVRMLLSGAVPPAPHGAVSVVSVALPPDTQAHAPADRAPAHPGTSTRTSTPDGATTATPAAATTSTANSHAARHRAVVRIELLAAALAMVALLTAALAWRRSFLQRRQRAAWERANYEREQQAFQRINANDPMQLAREIELILGPPAAHGAHYVRTPDAVHRLPSSPITAQAAWTAAPMRHPHDARQPA